MTRNQHYVPQFYLNHFCENGLLCGYDINERRFVKLNPRNICFEKYLYETETVECHENLGKYLCANDIEHIFCKYEGEYSKLQKKIIEICTNNDNRNALVLNSTEKNILCHYAVNLLIRNPKSMEILALDSLPDDVRNSDFYKEFDYVLRQMGIGSAESIFKAAQKKAELTFELSDFNPLVDEISKLNFCFFLTENDEFITSDYPVCFGNDLYIKDDTSTCLYLVLSPQIAVMFGNYPQSRKMRNRIIPIDNEKVRFFNQQIIAKSHYIRWIIAPSQSTLEKIIKQE